MYNYIKGIRMLVQTCSYGCNLGYDFYRGEENVNDSAHACNYVIQTMSDENLKVIHLGEAKKNNQRNKSWKYVTTLILLGYFCTASQYGLFLHSDNIYSSNHQPYNHEPSGHQYHN